jgi:DNA-binding transcriptional LysR family regulator
LDLIDLIKLRDLRVALTVKQAGGILAAARALNISQPSVTRTIQELEGKLGHKIFDRSTRGFPPTEYGRIFLRSATSISGELQSIQWELEQFTQGTKGTLRIGAMPIAVSGILVPLLNTLLETEPLLDFSIVEAPYDALMQLLSDREIDIVVGRIWDSSHKPGLCQEVLFHDHMRAVVNHSHPLANAKQLTFEDLLPWHWLFPPKETPVYDLMVSEFRRRGLELPKRRVETLSLSLLVSLIEGGQFVTALPNSMMRFNRTTRDIVALDLDLRNTENPIGAIYFSDQKMKPSQELFLQAIRQVELKL